MFISLIDGYEGFIKKAHVVETVDLKPHSNLGSISVNEVSSFSKTFEPLFKNNSIPSDSNLKKRI